MVQPRPVCRQKWRNTTDFFPVDNEEEMLQLLGSGVPAGWWWWWPLFAVVLGCKALLDLVARIQTSRFRRGANFANSERWVLVTGTSSGIGRTVVHCLVGRGFHVFAAVRSAQDYRAWLEEQEMHGKEGNSRVVPLYLDVTSNDSVQQAAQVAQDLLSERRKRRRDKREDERENSTQVRLWGIINNAGISLVGPMEETEQETIQRVMDVNAMGCVRVVQAFLPLMRNEIDGGEDDEAPLPGPAAQGRILFVSSVAAFNTLVFNGFYAASKRAMEAMADALRQELRPWRIGVSIIQPAMFRSPGVDKYIESSCSTVTTSSSPKNQGDKSKLLTTRYASALRQYKASVEQQLKGSGHPQPVAEVCWEALTAYRPSARYRVGPWADVLYYVQWLVPELILDPLLEFALARYG